MSKHYYPGPEWVDIDRHQESPIGNSRFPLPEGTVDRHEVFENRHRPPIKHGFIIDNGAAVKLYATFDFKFDDHVSKHVEIHSGDKVGITFNKPSRHDNIPHVITAEGIIKEIKIAEKGFIIMIDCSEEYKSEAYIIGSNAVLDIDLIKDEVQETPDDSGNDTPDADSVIEVIPPNQHCHGHHVHHHHHHLEDFYPDPNKPPYHIMPNFINWSNKPLTMVWDNHREYSVLDVVYAKKAGVDVLMIIYDLEGHIIYKALDNSKKVSLQSHFVWSLRDYISYINENVPIVDRLDRYTLDSSGKFVMTAGSVLDLVVREIDKSNDCFPEATQFIVELIAGENLLDYYPGGHTCNGRDVISKRLTITGDMLRAAFYNKIPVTPDPEPGTDEPDNPGNEEENKGHEAPSIGDDTPSNPDGTDNKEQNTPAEDESKEPQEPSTDSDTNIEPPVENTDQNNETQDSSPSNDTEDTEKVDDGQTTDSTQDQEESATE